MSTQAKQALPESPRRVRASAAMIGLAVSVGAYGLPLTHQGDTANAAEPTTPDANSSVSAPFETAALSVESAGQATSETSAATAIQHTVQEGQTLWDVARFYGTDAATLASANKLSLNAVLRVGQVLSIPVDNRIAQVTTDTTVTPGYYGVVATVPTPAIAAAPVNSAQVDAAYKAKQNQSVEVLKQRRESLRSSLASLSAKTQANSDTMAGQATTSVDSQATPTVVASTPLQPAPSAAVAPTTDQQVAFNSSNQFSGTTTGSLSAATHRVMPGDTLSGIARANGVSLRHLLEANRISDPNYIFVGQTLTIPGQRSVSLNSGQFDSKIAAVPSSTVVDVGSSTLPVAPTAAPANTARIAAVSTFPATRPTVDGEDANARILQYNHVENLKLEIDRMRNQFQARSGQPQREVRAAVRLEAPVASVAAAREPVNPEFNPDRYVTRLQEIRDRIRPGDRTQTPSPATPQARAPQLMAAAPLGSESYDPIKSRLGKTVSPELPTLGTGSEFLPSVPGQMNGFIWPAKGVLTSGYGWRWGRMHRGIDIAGPIGTPIHAAADGRITYAGWNSGGYGYLVEIQHPDGSLTLYAHNNRILVQVGQEVEQGQQIAEMGSTGYSTGPHLHFEVHPTGRGAVNPMAFLPRG